MRARYRAAALGAAALGVAVAGGCGGGQTRGAAFDPRWINDDGAGIAAFQRQIVVTPVPAGADVAVGVAGSARVRTLIGVPLDGGARWTFSHALDARPAIAGTVVVGLGNGELFALDARTGKLLWKRSAGGRLRGAGDDGATTVVSLASTTGNGSVILAINHDGEVVRQIEDGAAIGVPAVLGRYAFLPWQGQYVTVFDLQTGREVARALLRTQVSRVFLSGGSIFFGGAAATRLDDAIGRSAAGQASTVAPRARALPGAPAWMTPGTEVLAPTVNAADKIRIYARPTSEGAAAIEGDRFAATYYRVAVGFDATSGALAWAHAAEGDFLGGAAYTGGFALCDARGEVTLLDGKRGVVVGRASLGEALVACLVQADGMAKAETGPVLIGAEPLAKQIERVVTMPHAELMMIQRLLLRGLSALPDEGVTRMLIDMASGERTPPLLIEDAREALAARRRGVGFMLDALRSDYDFLAGVRSPPVGPLADALAAMNEKRSAPLLARHLNDPETSANDVRRAAAALATLAGPEELPALRTFFALYRGVDDASLAEAVVTVAEALVKLGDAEPVARAASDAFTAPGLRERLARLAERGGPKATLGR